MIRWGRPQLHIGGIVAQVALLPLVTFGLIHLISPPPSVALGMIVVACWPAVGLLVSVTIMHNTAAFATGALVGLLAFSYNFFDKKRVAVVID